MRSEFHCFLMECTSRKPHTEQLHRHHRLRYPHAEDAGSGSGSAHELLGGRDRVELVEFAAVHGKTGHRVKASHARTVVTATTR